MKMYKSSNLPDAPGYTAGELSAVFSNLAKGAEKQYKPEMSQLYSEIASYYKKKSEYVSSPDFNSLAKLVQADLDSGFPAAEEIAVNDRDRGARRALKWSTQVSKIIKSILTRLESGGTGFAVDKNVYVCDICGFIFVGNEKPEVCPVCKVPNFKMTQIKREA